MCGIIGVIAPPGERPSIDRSTFESMRDLMAFRGPDGAGLVDEGPLLFGHRRLAVMDPEHGHQPWRSPEGRFLLLYNGELYNDAELRASLLADYRVKFETNCDTETVGHAFAAWGIDALRRMRGMYALAVWDSKLNTLTLARDPLGIKPIYLARVGRELIFASYLPSLLAHPGLTPRPDLTVASSYLTTLKTTLGERTLFDGVFTLRPGVFAQASFEDGSLELRIMNHWRESTESANERSLDDAAAELRALMVDSVERHLRADVPRCLLLSGGIDSAIIATICRELGADDAMRTWCAGAPSEGESTDLEYARLMADRLGTDHHEVLLDEGRFDMLWRRISDANGLPLTTPNETAILAVAEDLRAHATVALSGEGADELFGGYAGPMLSAIDWIRATASDERWPGDSAERGRFRSELVEQYGVSDLGDEVSHWLRSQSWAHPSVKDQLLSDGFLEAIDSDRALIVELANQMVADGEDVHPAERWLRAQRRINLTGLLGRLDSSTMLASVEGRTPFADVEIANFAACLPFELKFAPAPFGKENWRSSRELLLANAYDTKRVLRRAFADDLPQEVLDRGKASFPLPFQQWMTGAAEDFRSSSFIGEFVKPEVRDILAQDPASNWQLAWPLFSLGRWAKRWWG